MVFSQLLFKRRNNQLDMLTNFDEIFLHFTNPIILLSESGQILHCNKATLELYFLKNAKIKNQDYLTVCRQNNIQPAFLSLDNLLTNSDFISTTNIIRDGSAKTIQWIVYPIKDNKKITYICLMGFDTTKFTKNFKEANQLRDSIIDHLPNHFIFWKDRNSIYLGCNKALVTSLGLKSSADIIGKTDYDLPTTKEESAAYRADDHQVMETGKPKLNIEETQTLKDGTKRILSTSKMPLFDEQGEVYGVLAIYSDITKQKQNEQQLLETNKKLENSHKVKSEFIRNISHDIRTPLAGIQQVTRALADGMIPVQEVSAYAASAWEASNKLMELFDQILDVSKKEHFDFEDQVVKFDLYRLLEDLEKTYAVVAKNNKVRLEIEYASHVPQYLLGKHLRLHRILMNLLGNALKFTKQGSVKLLVEKAQDMPEKAVLRFSVIDTGIGIPADKHQTIFEPFTRLTPSFQGQYPGSGLGLHVVKDYVEKMHGEIYVESEEGKGTMFTCVIPFKKPLLDNDNDVVETDYVKNILQEEVKLPIHDAVIPKTATAVIGTDSLVNNLVLLVEDDKTAQMMSEMLLKKNGYQVDVASSGEEALSLTARNTYALIYMDLGLGDGIDGTETTRRIRVDQNNLNQHVFITALTAHGSSDEEIVKKCKNAGMQHILSKPLTTEKIIQMQNLVSKDENADDNEKLIIDFDLWRARLGYAAHLLEKLVHILGNEFPIYREKIKNTYETGDLATLKAITHKFKGALFSSGYPRLEAAIVAIESAAKQANMADVDKWYPEVMEALDEAEEVYEKWAKMHPKQG